MTTEHQTLDINHKMKQKKRTIGLDEESQHKHKKQFVFTKLSKLKKKKE